MIEITQPTPRNIGRRKTQNTNPTIEAMMIATTLATLFMRLRLEMDALPRLSDMLLFVFIVRHFFYASIDYRSFACSLLSKAWLAQRDVRPRQKKYEPTAGRSGDFFCRKAKEYPGQPRSPDRASNYFHSWCCRNKLERRPRVGENGHQHIGMKIFKTMAHKNGCLKCYCYKH